jgi:protein O-mannosyl-transferase
LNDSAASRRRRLGWWAAAAVALLACCAYGAALAGDYVFDDVHSVAANPAVHDVANVGRFFVDPSAFSSGSARMYRPVLLTSFALNFLVGDAAAWLKLGNVLLHALAAVLLLRWAWAWTRRLPAAALAAAWFAVHPLASEAVNLVSARSELLATVGMLGCLVVQLDWLRRGASFGRGVLIVFAAVVACGSKETGVVLPVLAAVQAWCVRRGRAEVAVLRRAAGSLLMLVAVVVAYLLARKLLLGEATVQLLDRTGEDPTSGHGRTLLTQLLTMGTLLPGAVGQMLWPWPLSLDPAVRFRHDPADAAVWFGWIALAVLTAAALACRGRRAPAVGVAFAWCVALPWIVVPLNMPLAEHRLYGPLAGVALLVAGLVPRLRSSSRALQRAARIACAAAAVLFVVGSAHRSLLYRDERTLWRAELAVHPMSFRAHWGLGTSTLRHGDVDGAVEPLARAHALYPQHYDALRNYCEALVVAEEAAGNPHRALVLTERLRAVGPEDPWVRTLVARAHLLAARSTGDAVHWRAAEQAALGCLEVAPPKGYVFQLAAMARRGAGDLEGALGHLDESLRRGIDTVGVRLDRADLLRALGRERLAQRELMAAQAMAPMDPSVLAAVRSFAAPR